MLCEASGRDREGECKRIVADVSKSQQMTSKPRRGKGFGMSLAGVAYWPGGVRRVDEAVPVCRVHAEQEKARLKLSVFCGRREGVSKRGDLEGRGDPVRDVEWWSCGQGDGWGALTNAGTCRVARRTLRQGAVADHGRPWPWTGCGDWFVGRAHTDLRQVYAALLQEENPFLVVDLATAELVKTAANAFLATKISVLHAVSDVCAAAGADVTVLADSIEKRPPDRPEVPERRYRFRRRCPPKDIRAFMARPGELGVGQSLLTLREMDSINCGTSRSGGGAGRLQVLIRWINEFLDHIFTAPKYLRASRR